MEEYEGRIEWTKYLNIIWKKKWLIIIPALLCAVAAGVFSFLQPSEWEVTTTIQPGLFFNTERNERGLIIEGEILAGQINEGYYSNSIAAELNLNIIEVPKISARKLRWTELVEASIKTPDVERAKLILHSLFNLIKNEIDPTIESTAKTSDAQVSNYRSIIKIETQGIQSLENGLSQQEKEIQSLKNELKKSATGKLAQEQIRSLLSDKEYEKRMINADIDEKRITIELAKIEINSLTQKKGQIDYTQFIKEPTASLHPVAPRKILNMVLAGILGLIIFGLFAFFIEYIESIKSRS